MSLLRTSVLFIFSMFVTSILFAQETSTGWKKYESNPVLGGAELGTCFDITMTQEDNIFKMWFSWRPKKSLAYTESKDGISWSEPKIVLPPNPDTEWEKDINRPAILKRDGVYHLWYTGQWKGRSALGYATSKDGINFERKSAQPVLTAEKGWEKEIAVMCPHVEWDANAKQYKMWYSGGEQYEPNAIGYATSPDGLTWTKHPQNPIFSANKEITWEHHKVAGVQILKHGDWYLMFYIGYENEHLARIGIARSKDGITNWDRLPTNPIISPTQDGWDASACYKPFAIYDVKENQWRLWYNGRNKALERIGLATHDGEDLGFPDKTHENIIPDSVVQNYVERFNASDDELYKQFIPNDKAADFLVTNIPRFECPDKELEEIYYFRWWTFRKHVKQTPDGFIITEFLPNVPWAGKYNGISCSAVYHYGEGRWLHNHEFLNSYTKYWLRDGGNVRSYSFPIVHALYNDYLATGNDTLIKEYFPDLIANYEAWEKDKFDTKHNLFWQIDDRDWGELTIGGHGLRPLINSFMIGDAIALSKIAKHLGYLEQQKRFEQKATDLQNLMWEKLWDNGAQFYKVVQLWEKHPTRLSQRGTPKETPTLADVRELYGYAPWMFGIAKPEHHVAWKFLMNPKHFYAPFGLSFAEQSHPKFAISYEGHECKWDGPSWPMSTTLTLLGLANLLQTQEQNVITKKDYLDLLKVYAHSHHLTKEDGTVVPWIDENLNPFTGDWIARTRLKTWKNGTWDKGKGGVERGKDYNHSEFCDLIISGLVGLRPAEGNVLTVCPLITDNDWEWFALENVSYHGKTISVVWDKTGKKYNKGNGFMVFVDGKKAAASEHIGELKVDITTGLPAQLGKIQWKKYEKNPVIGGGSFGTIVDGVVLKEGDGYNMYTVWRPKKSLAIHTSKDGFTWSEPEIVLSPSKTEKWEPDLRGEIVLQKDGVYHMWYTGQAGKLMNIGYATSSDGRNWTRQSEQPIITPTQKWEKAIVMGPHVLWDEQEKVFKMWYSGGGNHIEPEAIGYATSKDGKTWEKYSNNPVFKPEPSNHWEQNRVAACQVIKREKEKDYLMFYIGYRDQELAQIGMARSPDGISHWVRYDGNPIISPTPDSWDASACYRPFVVYEKENKRWLLYYNGRNVHLECMGVAIYDSDEIEF